VVTAGMRVCLVAREEPGTTGTSRYVASLTPRLKAAGNRIVPLATTPAGLAARAAASSRTLGFDAGAFLSSYPIRWRWPAADVYHLSGQTYASVLLFTPPPGPVVVTVHDIIPYLVRHEPRLNVYRHPLHRLFDWLAMRGLRRAGALIADSEWTRLMIVQQLGIPRERITTVPLGVDSETYRPLDVPEAYRRHHNLTDGRPHILYVGSEDPRKNLEALWRAFAQVCDHFPGSQLLKAGRGHHPAERRRLNRLAEQLEIAARVRFLEDVPEEDLPLLYNAARVYVQPSLYEGFGLPVLEALACGTHVVSSDRAALPELAGADSVSCAPEPEPLADALAASLCQKHDAASRDARRAWAARFSWDRTSAATVKVLARTRSRQ
jgi:glycosyltransferase involved in cell wall biosynthesis